jgi:oxygen-dependent protoporphyrinogen oxidase
MNSQYDTDIVIMGAGMAGLAAAHQLISNGLDVIVLEKSPNPGGRTSTVIVDDQPVDLGAAFISDFYADTRRLITETGLTTSFMQRSQTAYIARDQKVYELWPLKQLLGSDALTLSAKFRLLELLPPLLTRWKDLDITDLEKCIPFDRETAAQFSRKSLGEQATRYFFGPLLRGLLYWDAETTSAAMVFCILKSFGRSKGTYRFSRGMQQIVDALSAAPKILCNSEVMAIAPAPDSSFKVSFTTEGRKEEFTSRGVICAAPAPSVLAVAPWLPSPARSFLESVSYSKTAILTFAVSADAADYPKGAILFPSDTVRDLSSVNPLYQYVDEAGDAPQDTGRKNRLLNVYLSNQGALDAENLGDDALGQYVLSRVSELLGSPDWVPSARLANVKRWPLAIPRFKVGHIEGIQEFQSAVRSQRGIAFAGDYLMGPYIDGAVRSGLAAASMLSQQLVGADQ